MIRKYLVGAVSRKLRTKILSNDLSGLICSFLEQLRYERNWISLLAGLKLINKIFYKKLSIKAALSLY